MTHHYIVLWWVPEDREKSQRPWNLPRGIGGMSKVIEQFDLEYDPNDQPYPRDIHANEGHRRRISYIESEEPLEYEFSTWGAVLWTSLIFWQEVS